MLNYQRVLSFVERFIAALRLSNASDFDEGQRSSCCPRLVGPIAL